MLFSGSATLDTVGAGIRSFIYIESSTLLIVFYPSSKITYFTFTRVSDSAAYKVVKKLDFSNTSNYLIADWVVLVPQSYIYCVMRSTLGLNAIL